VDTFAEEHLPPRDQWPHLIFNQPHLQYSERLNCASYLLDQALEEGHAWRIAVYSDDTAWTWAELRDKTDRIANVLVREFGVVPGNRVLLRSPNSPMLTAAWLAVMKVGAIAVTSVPLLRAKELAGMAEKARIDHVLCDARIVDEVRQASAATNRLRYVVTFGDGQLEALMARQPDGFEAVDTACDDVCLIAFTSGTTSAPKATMHFHRDVLAMTDVVARHLLHTQADDIYIGSPPLGFTFGLGALLVFPLRFRAATVMLEKTSPESLLGAIQRFGATCLFTAPTMYRGLVAKARHYDLSSLRRCVSAGEPLPRTVFDAWHGATGLRLIDGIGSTEMIHIFIGAAGDEIRPGATGRVLPGYEACVLDETYSPLPRERAGRLAVRGPTGCRYLDDARQTDSVVNGWNVTGDRYFVDQDGYFWFQARADDLIISSGYNISGVEVEEALLAHPAVLECAVVGMPDGDRGNLVRAFVVLRDNPPHSAADLVKELQDFVKRLIAPYKYPRVVTIVESLPKTATGKIQRSILRQTQISDLPSS